MIAEVRAQLGTATEALYRRMVELAERATGDAQRAIARIALDVACGTFHDYRSGRPLPKGDLIEALRAVPPQAGIDEERAALEREVLLGCYDDGEAEARRWALEMAPIRPPPPPRGTAAPPIALAPREQRARIWLLTHVAATRRGASLSDVAAGLGVHRLTASELMRALARKGAAVNVGDGAGWLPVTR